MKIFDIAGEVFNDLGRPSSISVASIAYWMKSNIGLLNIQISSDYTLDDSGEADPEIGKKEAAIFKCLYKVNYFSRKIRSNLGAAAYIPVTQISSEGVRMKKIDKTDIAKTIAEIRKDAANELDTLTTEYNKRNAKIAAISIYP